MAEPNTMEWCYDNGHWDKALEMAVKDNNHNMIRIASRAVLLSRDRFSREAVELAATYNEDNDLRSLCKDITLKAMGVRPADAPFVPEQSMEQRIAAMIE